MTETIITIVRIQLATGGHVELTHSEQEPGTPRCTGMGVHCSYLWVRIVADWLPDGWHRAQWTETLARWRRGIEDAGGYLTAEMRADCWEGEARRRGWREP